MNNLKNNYNREEYKEDYLRILPPGTETNSNLYGTLNLSAGELSWLKTSFPPENTKVRVSFWGQQGSGRVIIAKNAAEELKNYYVSELEYEIRCPVVLFQKYLQDMVRLRIDILDKRNDKVVGNVYINMLLFLKSNPKAVNTPIEDIKGLFPIFKVQTNCNKPNMTEKIGEIEFEMNVRFTKQPLNKAFTNKQQDPQQQHLDSSFMYNEMKANLDHDQFSQQNQHEQENRNPAQNRGNMQQQQQRGLTKIQEDYNEQQSDQFMDSNQQNKLRAGTGMTNQSKNNQSNLNSQHMDRNVHFENAEQQKRQNELDKEKQEKEDEEKVVTNVKLQKILKEKQGEEYMFMMEKQNQKMMEQSTRFDELEILAPDLELMKLRMDEVELISGLTAGVGVYSDLADIPPEGLPDQINLDLKNVKGYAVHADTFQVTNMLYKKKLQKSQLSLTIQVPIFEFTEDGSNKIFYDQLYITCRRQLNLEQSSYEFNQSFPCKFQLSESNISQLTDSRIFFQLFVGDEDPSTRIEFARGEFRFDQLFMKPYHRGAFEIPMYASANFTTGVGKNTTQAVGGNTKNQTGKNATAKNGNKENTQANSIAGELCISVSLLERLSPYGSEQLNLQPTPAERQKKEIKTKQAIKKYAEISNMKNIPFQIFLLVQSLSNMQRNISVNEQIIIRHKIYGRNENLEGNMASIDFASKNILFNYKSIMPVDQQSIQKMNIVPFVLEIWKKNKVNPSAYSPNGTEDFIGLIRFNLKSIPELITNPQAFSSNLYPTMLVEGEMPIWDPSTNRNVGICNVSFAFGTVQQVQFYDQKIAAPQIINQISQQTHQINNQIPQRQQQQQQDQTFIPKNNKNIIFVADDNALVKHQQQMFIINDKSQGLQNNSQAESQSDNIGNSQASHDKPIQIPKFKMIRFDNMEYSKEPINKVFVLVMENIRRNKRRAQNILRNFIIKAEKHEKRVTLREFYNFLNDIPIQEALHIKNGYLHKLISVLDFEESGEINTTDFVKSYNSFLNYEDILRDSYSYAIKEFSLQLANKSFTIADFERIITSEFGFVRREYFKNILEKDFECENILVNRLIDLLDVHEDGLIQANMLPDYLRSIEVYEKLNYINCDSTRYAELVKQNLQENLLKNEEGVQELIQNDELADKEMSARDIQYLIQGLGLDISFWEATCIIESIRLQINIPVTEPSDEFKLPFVYLSDWLQFIMKQKKEDPQFNYYSYLIEQRNRVIEEQLLNNQLSDRRGGQKSAPTSHRNQQQLTENSSNKYTDRSQIKKSDLKQQQNQEDDEEDLIQLVKNNYKKV